MATDTAKIANLYFSELRLVCHRISDAQAGMATREISRSRSPRQNSITNRHTCGGEGGREMHGKEVYNARESYAALNN